jgi:hypothetical protein
LQVDASQKGRGFIPMQLAGQSHFLLNLWPKPNKMSLKLKKKYKESYLNVNTIISAYSVYGMEVKDETDHKPLFPIMKKPLHSVPPRFQRMIMYLQWYHLHVHFLTGKLIPVADTLSRKYIRDTNTELSKNMEIFVHSIVAQIQIVYCQIMGP